MKLIPAVGTSMPIFHVSYTYCELETAKSSSLYHMFEMLENTFDIQ